MPIPNNITAEHVQQAIEELDSGAMHPFGKPTKFVVVQNGKQYAPKAVIGFAAKYAAGESLGPDDFSGGEASGQANAILRELGFDVQELARNPKWSRDELILALDLYFRHRPDGISKTHGTVVELSEVLNRLPIHSVRPDQHRFRNANGVYMKLCNFLRFDPSYHGEGLSRGGADEEKVWDEYVNDQVRLHAVADAIRSQVAEPQFQSGASDDDDFKAPEGRILLQQHKVRERNPGLVKRKKRKVLCEHDCLKCEVCGLEFSEFYGDLGEVSSNAITAFRCRNSGRARRRDSRIYAWCARIAIDCSTEAARQ